ncbi:MAG: three component ABC system middle component [Opitutaceae bacterium]
MNSLSDEVRLWNTPAFGAYLVWKFTSGYSEHHATGEGPVALLHFIATAILTSPMLAEPISNRRKSLESYVRSFHQNEQTDLLYGVHARIKERRLYTMASIDIAVANGLLVWDAETGKLYSKDLSKRPSRGCKPKVEIIRIGDKAEILGGWLASHKIETVSHLLGVKF